MRLGMKSLIVAVTLFCTSALAQPDPSYGLLHASSPGNGPSYTQLHCAGLISRHSISRADYVLGSKESPQEDRLQGRSLLFLRGPGLAEGERYSLLRQILDPNREDSSPKQRVKFGKLGSLYEDVGWVTVRSIQNGTAIASFDFSCGAALPGDLVVPFVERPEVEFRKIEPEVDAFLATTSANKGQILGSRDYIGLLGTGLIVYTDFGSAKGAKPGDYLMVIRGYAPGDLNLVDRITEDLPKGAEITAVHPVRVTAEEDKHLLSHVLGELLVMNVTPESSTAIITRAFAELELGDVVQEETPSYGGEQATDVPAVDNPPCRPPSLLRRVLFLSHGCKH